MPGSLINLLDEKERMDNHISYNSSNIADLVAPIMTQQRRDLSLWYMNTMHPRQGSIGSKV
jgi:hypothetical protein